MPINKWNYTGRLSILRSSAHITLRNPEADIQAFDCELDIDGLGLPNDAKVFIEAYRRSSFMRFDFGTVGAMEAPTDRRLSEIDRGDRIYFRVKIVDPSPDGRGRIIAQADTIPVSTPGKNSNTILPVQGKDLGQVVWKVAIYEEGPELQLNENIPGIMDLPVTNGEFQALVYTAAFEQILWRIVVEDLPVEDPEHWSSDWARLASRVSGKAFLNPRDFTEEPGLAAEEIEVYVGGFANQFRMRERLAGAQVEG